MEAMKCYAYDIQVNENVTFNEAWNTAQRTFDKLSPADRATYMRLAIADDPAKKQERIETREMRREARTGIVGDLAK